ncbi:MAG: hypothetical protein C4530_14565 [Desulfobacteraceae bacterium]|nr:MAG: hypothetical protein C4530_14565 [Desulfobacteraceae bacterium]
MDMQEIDFDPIVENKRQPAMKRTRTCVEKRSVFDDLFEESGADSFPELEGLREFVYRGSPNDESARSMKEEGRNGNPAGKKKATYYLSEKVLVELFDAKAKIRILVPPSLKSKVSMSRIVDYAVGAILEEFNSAGRRSDLFQQIIEDDKRS